MTSRVGDLLVKTGHITTEQLQRANEAQKSSGGSIGSQIVKLGFISEDDLLQSISNQYGVPIVELSDYEIDINIVQLIPQKCSYKTFSNTINQKRFDTYSGNG